MEHNQTNISSENEQKYIPIDRNGIDRYAYITAGINTLMQRESLRKAQEIAQIAEARKSELDKYAVMDSELQVESFIKVLAEKHGVRSRQAEKIIQKINDKKRNPSEQRVVDWVKEIYDKAADFGAQEQRAVFNILLEKNWTEKLKDKNKDFSFTNKMIKKWKFSKEELAGSTIEIGQGVKKVYEWYEKSAEVLKFLPVAGVSTVYMFLVKSAAVLALFTLKYQNNDTVINNKSLHEMIDSFKNKEKKDSAYWIKENLEKFRENFPERSFNNQKQFMINVEKLYGKMDFNTKRMFATTDPIIVINLMDEAARKNKFKLFDKNIPDEKVAEFHYTMMSLVLEKMREPSFRKNIIIECAEKDKKDRTEVLKIYEFEKKNFVLEALSQWKSTISSYRLDLERARDDISKVKFAVAGNVKAQEYVEQIFEKINEIDSFFYNIEKENTTGIFSAFKSVGNLFRGQGYKSLNSEYQEKFNQLNVRELDQIKNHLDYSLKDNDKARKDLATAFKNIYNFKPQTNIQEMTNKWEVSIAVLRKEMKDFGNKTDRGILDYVKQGITVISSKLLGAGYVSAKFVNNLNSSKLKVGVEVFINAGSLALKGVETAIEIGVQTTFEKIPKWYIQIENKFKRADTHIKREYGQNEDAKEIISDLKKNDAPILKSMLLKNIQAVEKHREEKEASSSQQNKNRIQPK